MSVKLHVLMLVEFFHTKVDFRGVMRASPHREIDIPEWYRTFIFIHTKSHSRTVDF